ncbi:MAG: beta-phosphoglucomutase [Pseudomonadota bacterium]|nr:beta-phosphoglucomutase [Pseudomonadota bacterium]
MPRSVEVATAEPYAAARGAHGAPSVPAASTTSADSWCLRQTTWDPTRRGLDESLFALANGSLGVRGGLEETCSGTDTSFLASVHERNRIDYHERFVGFTPSTDTRIPVPDGKRISIRLGRELLDLDTAEWLDFERVLDLRTGVLRRRLLVRTPQGATLQICSERLVSLTCDVLAIRFSVTSVDYRGPIALISSVEAGQQCAVQGDDPRIGVAISGGLAAVSSAAAEHEAVLVQRTRRSDIEVACGQCHRLTDDGLAFAGARNSDDRVEQQYHAALEPGQQVSIDKFVAYASTGAAAEPAKRVQDLLADALAGGFERLATTQEDELTTFWRNAGVAIDGDASAEFALRFNLFHLMQSTSRNPGHGTAAKGLTGEGYEGHCFWDTEVFVLPVMVFTAPEIAATMLRFRHGTLAAARANARDMNHTHGALYPWRTIAGGECSAHYPSGSAAYHINAAIAYAVGLYLDASGDIEFLLEAGAEMLFETARIWPQVGHFDRRRGGAFGIHGITGPDEYSALVDNNFYTNRMAQQHLLRAAAVWKQLSSSHPLELAALASRLALDAAEVQIWERAAESMQLPYDEEHGVYTQDDAFLNSPRWDFAANATDRPLLLVCHPLTLYRHQICKQADVVMALVLAGHGFERARKRRSFDYYESVTTHDSTLSAPVFGILASELGRHEQARRYFDDSLQVDLDDRHGNTHHGVHMAAMAGSWLGLAWGFAGMRVVDGELSFSPNIPRGWRRYEFSMRWRGRRLKVETTAEGTRYSLLEGAPLQISADGRTMLLLPGEGEDVLFTAVDESADAEVRMHFPRHCRALIFDLDGVLTDTARVHYRAWKRLADEIGVSFDEVVNERLKGVDRMRSLDIILERANTNFSDEEKREFAARKNGYYVDMIITLGPEDLFPGVRELLHAARSAGLRLALASASRNAATLLERLEIADAFDFVVDAAGIQHPKPHPEIFLAAAKALEVAPEDCIGIEDAEAGVTAIKAAGMAAIGIGSETELALADAVLPSIGALRLDSFVRRVRRSPTQQPTVETENERIQQPAIRPVGSDCGLPPAVLRARAVE